MGFRFVVIGRIDNHYLKKVCKYDIVFR